MFGKSGWIVVVAVFVGAGCAARGEWATDKEANRVIGLKKEMDERYNACRNAVWINPSYGDYWKMTAYGAQDNRELSLVEVNKPITKSYREQTRVVAKDLIWCEAEALHFGKQITQAYGEAFAKANSYVTNVQVNVIEGKYKTYGEMNKSYFEAMRTRQALRKAASDKVANDLVASIDAEAAYKQQMLATGLMMSSGVSQGGGYNPGNVVQPQTTQQSTSQRGLSSQQIGNQTIYSNGVTSQQIGNQTIYSNGVRCQQIGNQRICN